MLAMLTVRMAIRRDLERSELNAVVLVVVRAVYVLTHQNECMDT